MKWICIYRWLADAGVRIASENKLRALSKELIKVEVVPENEIWIKIGGDKGGGSFKMNFQICNVLTPNSKTIFVPSLYMTLSLTFT